jgi:Cu2+-exporting ATPase
LRELGVQRIVTLTGDNLPAARAVAQQVGIDEVFADLLPQEKIEQVRLLSAAGPLAMVGDGVNDAPVLAQAQLSIAMGSGALLSQAHADVVLLSGRLRGLLEGLEVARRAQAVVRQNLVWAATYNLIALPLAAAGLVTPWLAGIGMGVSSLVVVLNALRLAKSPTDRNADIAASRARAAAPDVRSLSSQARA